jgi:molecular chaperone DnaJ
MERPEEKDYYRILGVPRDASLAAIKRAYRRLARKFRPKDVVATHTGEAFRDVQAAYETLADAERRRRYDEALRHPGGPDPLAWSFVRQPAAGELRRPTPTGVLSGEVILSRHEAAAGGLMPLKLPVPTPCPGCRGTGGAVFDCVHCDGEGFVARRLPMSIRVPARVRDGEVFQIATGEPGVPRILITVHVLSF